MQMPEGVMCLRSLWLSSSNWCLRIPSRKLMTTCPLAALLQVSREQPAALSNDDVAMSPGPRDLGPSSSSGSSSSSLKDLQFHVGDASAVADPGPPPPAVPVPDDRPAPHEASEPVEEGPGADAAANPPHPPAAARHHVLFWEDVTCPDCNRTCGQFKYSPGPWRRGGSDPPTWIMRVKKDDANWPDKGPCFHRRVAHIVSDEYPQTWISRNKRCCRR
eukprot:s3343_g3.t1